MNTALVVLLLSFLVIITMITVFIISSISVTEEELAIPERELLLVIDQESDKIITSKKLSEKLGISVPQATKRLRKLQYSKVLKVHYDSRFRSYYSLIKPLNLKDLIPLSPEPFITLGDLLKLFAANDYQLTLQDLIMSTGLPMSIIKKELKKFEKEEVIIKITEYSNSAGGYVRYILDDNYKEGIDSFLGYSQEIDLELERLTKPLINKMNL